MARPIHPVTHPASPSRSASGSSAALHRAFEATPSLFSLLRTARSRRVGLGYRIDSGTSARHPITGRQLAQASGPLGFISERDPVSLSEVEEALLCWAACGPNGMVAWDVSSDGGFNQLAEVAGRTVPEPNNVFSTDLLVVNDRHTFIYRPDLSRREVVEPTDNDDGEYGRVLDWYHEGQRPILDHRPDIDWGMRFDTAPHSPLNGPHQRNMNLPGSSWFIPLTDAAKLANGLLDLFATRHAYIYDDFAGDVPAGLEPFIGPGRLELAVALSEQEAGTLRASTYPASMMVQNIRLATEALGLGAWTYSGFSSELLFGVHPELTWGLGFHCEPPNPRAPIATGRIKTFGIKGLKEATYVPSPRFATAADLVAHWHEERHGPGGIAADDENMLLSQRSPWHPSASQRIIDTPRQAFPGWAYDAALAFITYCVDRYGQWPVTYNPMLAGFSVQVHHVDCGFYDQHYRPGMVTPRIREHFRTWHPDA